MLITGLLVIGGSFRGAEADLGGTNYNFDLISAVI